MTKATLHDDLMREAGFEADYHRDVERRRERRHRARAWAVAHALVIVLAIAGLIELWGHYLPGIPRPLVLAAVAIGFVAQAVHWLKRLVSAMEDQP
jgi:hypothetical protein